MVPQRGDEKRLEARQPTEGEDRVGVFHHPVDRDVKTLSRSFPRKKSFEVLVQLR
jgi:hypothetical protein